MTRTKMFQANLFINKQKVETTQISMYRRMDKGTVVYSYNILM